MSYTGIAVIVTKKTQRNVSSLPIPPFFADRNHPMSAAIAMQIFDVEVRSDPSLHENEEEEEDDEHADEDEEGEAGDLDEPEVSEEDDEVDEEIPVEVDALIGDKVAAAGELRTLQETPPPPPLSAALQSSSSLSVLQHDKGLVRGVGSGGVGNDGKRKPQGRGDAAPVKSGKLNRGGGGAAAVAMVGTGGEGRAEKDSEGVIDGTVATGVEGFSEMIKYFGRDPGEGSPLTAMRRDERLWGGAEAVGAVREAELRVGRTAAAVAKSVALSSSAPEAGAGITTADEGDVSFTGVGGGSGGSVVARADDKMKYDKMSPELGRALVEWSTALRAAKRPMASFFALQAAMMGILNARRQFLRLAPGERVDEAAKAKTGKDRSKGEADVGSGGDGHGVADADATVSSPKHERYGYFDRLRQEFLEATGISITDQWLQRLMDNDEYTIDSLLDGVPWLTRESDGALVWMPPSEVAEALDSDPAQPTAWMSGVGNPGGGGGQEELTAATETATPVAQKGEERAELLTQHPCLQQFMTYLAYRDDVDLARALQNSGYTHSAWLVLGRVVAGAAELEARNEGAGGMTKPGVGLGLRAGVESTGVSTSVSAAAAMGSGMKNTGRAVGGSRGGGGGGKQRRAKENSVAYNANLMPRRRKKRYEAASAWRAKLLRRAADLAGFAVITPHDTISLEPAVPTSVKSNDIVGLAPGLWAAEEEQQRLAELGDGVAVTLAGKVRASVEAEVKAEAAAMDATGGGAVTTRDDALSSPSTRSTLVGNGGATTTVAADDDANGKRVGGNGSLDTDTAAVLAGLEDKDALTMRIGGNGDAGAMMLLQQKMEKLLRTQGQGSRSGSSLSSVELDSQPEAFWPRFEAARFLLDLHCECDFPSAIGGGDKSGLTVGQQVKGNGKGEPSGLDRQLCLDLLVVAAVKSLQVRDKREGGRGIRIHNTDTDMIWLYYRFYFVFHSLSCDWNAYRTLV